MGYEEMQNQTDVEVFRAFAKDQILRDRKGGIPRTFKHFKSKISSKSRDGFKRTTSNVEQKEKESNRSKKSKRD